MIRRPPRSTRTDTLFPYTTLFRSRLKELVQPGAAQAELPKDSADLALGRLDHFRNANGGSPTAEVRVEMQRAMSAHAAVFRTDDLMAEGKDKLAQRQDERRLGKECVSKSRTRW